MKLFIITKKQLMAAICIVCGLVLAVAGSVGAIAATNRLLPIYSVETEKKQIAISFDAAWGNSDTQKIIDVLNEYGVKATFFAVGAWVDKYPESVKALCDAGHSVQNHSNSHPHMPQLSIAKMKDEITSCNQKIKAITGVEPTLLRPPYGDYDNTLIETVESLDMYTIQWDVDSLDWKDSSTAESICKRVISKAKNGSIILCHNGARHTAEALPTILDTLKKDGYEFVLISDLIYKENYEIDHTGKQCKIKDGE